jgi:hypothetical protein
MSTNINELIAEYINAGKRIIVCQPKNAPGIRFFNPRNDVLKEERADARFYRGLKKPSKKVEQEA